MAPQGSGTLYRGMAIHKDEASRQQREAMGFQEGWGKALDQLIALMRRQQAVRHAWDMGRTTPNNHFGSRPVARPSCFCE